MPRSIITRTTYARTFLNNPINDWIPQRDRVEALAFLVIKEDGTRLGKLEALGPLTTRQASLIDEEQPNGDHSLPPETKLAAVLLMMTLMRQIEGTVRNVHWNGIRFFLQDGELRAERSPHTHS